MTIKRLIQVLFAVIVGPQMTACDKAKTVTWEEEVSLNTGETIVVRRSGTYTFKSEPGNPLKFDYLPDWRSTIEFNYKGKRYTHTDVVTLLLLAIRPDGIPVLLADPRRNDWHWKNKYFCVTPYYVQFNPDSTGAKWSWPEKIDSWLYQLPTNLVFGLPPISSNGKRYLPIDQKKNNVAITESNREFERIDSTYSSNKCPPRS